VPARNPPSGGLPTRGRHDARCPMALHRPENPDLGLSSDPPAGALDPSRTVVSASRHRLSTLRARYGGATSLSDRTRSPRRLCAACHHQKISDQRPFQSGWMQSATPCHGRQGSRTASAPSNRANMPARCVIRGRVRLVCWPAAGANPFAARRGTKHEGPRGSCLGGFSRFRLCHCPVMFSHNTVHPGQMGQTRRESAC
jgi:hypothetical protein